MITVEERKGIAWDVKYELGYYPFFFTGQE